MCYIPQVWLDTIFPTTLVLCHLFQAFILVHLCYRNRLLICLHGSNSSACFTVFYRYYQNYFSENRLHHVSLLKGLMVPCSQKQCIKRDSLGSSHSISSLFFQLHLLLLVFLSFIVPCQNHPPLWLHPSVLEHDLHVHTSITLCMLLLLPELLFLLSFPHDHPFRPNLN